MEHCALGVLLSMLVFDYCLVLLAEATIWERGGGGSWERGGGGRGYAYYIYLNISFSYFLCTCLIEYQNIMLSILKQS